MNTETEKLNDDWINNFEKTDNLYKDFYKDELYYTNLNYVYVNKNNEIEKIRHESFIMSKPNYVTREEIIRILKVNTMEDGRRYGLLSILKYNITLDSQEIKNFLTTSEINLYNQQFFIPIKNIDDIFFEKTINMFQDLNDLIFLFYEKSNEVIKPNNSENISRNNSENMENNINKNDNNFTKKVYLYRSLNSRRKTIKKRYKETAL